MIDGLRVLAVVPARAGSKGVPRKNMAEIGGLSMIARAGRVVAACDWIDGAVLSTDDADFAEEGRAAGLDVPGLRPAELATDTATGVAVWAHAWTDAERAHGTRYDLSVYLQPTSPFRTPRQVRDTVDAMLAGGHQAATTVSPVPGHYTPQKVLLMDEGGMLSFLTADGANHSNRQTARPCWTRNGLAYAARRAHVVDHGLIVERDCGAVVVDGYVANIDDPEDLLIARLLAAHGGYDPFEEGP
ncbi:MAG: acylneuraminate cytidylyltransferase family protein [Pseudomonadota bacterium]